MSQRVTAVAADSGQPHEDVQRQTHAASENHLMPSSLRRVPSWFQPAPFQYNLRFMISFLPGALLVATVTGKLMVGAAVLGAVVALLLRSSEQKYLAMVVSIAHVFFMAVLNVYCMAPLVWQSVLNIPLFFLIHSFIATSGLWWLMQDEEFRKQDPRFIILVERMLFASYPGVTVVMVTWVSAMLFGKTAIPVSVAVAGMASLSLFLSPLKSSFAKPGTPTNIGMIQHWSMALIYISLELAVPAILHFTLIHNDSFASWMTLPLLVVSPVFLLALLESQGLPSWLGLSSGVVAMVRWSSGAVVMVLLSLLAWQSSSLLSLLLIPLSFTLLTLLSSLDSPLSPTSLTLGLATAFFSSATFIILPWSISYSFSLFSLPLTIVQLLTWCVTMAAIAMVIFHKQASPSLWIAFNIMFVFLEYTLSLDGVYSHYLALTTALLSALLLWRLHVAGYLSPDYCLSLSSFHLTKLSLLLPSDLYTSPPSPLTTCVSIFLIAFFVLRLSLFLPAAPLSPGQLLVFCGLLCSGLLLGVDSILSPLWVSFTHQPPSSASLIATITAGTALYMNYGLDYVKSSEAARLSHWPPTLFLASLLLFLLQPVFDPGQMIEAVVVALSSSEDIPTELTMTAWGHLLSWAVLGAAVLLAVALATNMLVVVSSTVLGGALGAMATRILLLATPLLSLWGLLYLMMGGITGALLGRAYATPTTRKGQSFLDHTLFAALVIMTGATFAMECLTSPHVYMPRMQWFDQVSVPCSRMGMAVFASIAFGFRVKMAQSGEQPYVFLAANVSCLLFFLLSLLNPLHTQFEISVVLTSLVFLLLQPDGWLLPQSSSLFLAPSLMAASLLLYLLSSSHTIPKTLTAINRGPSIFLATRCLELLCLAASIPGQVLFQYYLWTGRQLHLSVFRLVLFILPNAFLPQFSSTLSSTMLGITGGLSFCLIILGAYSNGLKLTS